MKIVSTLTNHLFDKSLGLSETITLTINEETEVSNRDGRLLLQYEGVEEVKQAKTEVKNIKTNEVVEETPIETPIEVTETLS